MKSKVGETIDTACAGCDVLLAEEGWWIFGEGRGGNLRREICFIKVEEKLLGGRVLDGCDGGIFVLDVGGSD